MKGVDFRPFALLLFTCLVTLSVAAQTPDPLIGFDFDEGSGESVMDLSGQHTGTFGFAANPDALVTLTDESPSGAAGDKSAFFNGTSSVLFGQDTDNPFLDVVDGPITSEAWVNVVDYPVANVDIYRYGSSYKFGFSNGNLLFTHFGIADYFSEAAIEPGAWHHVAAVWDAGSSITYYVDGVEMGVVETTNASRAIQNNDLIIGGSTGGSFFHGSIDRLRVHHAVLTPDQLDSDPANPKPPLDTTLLDYDFNEMPAVNQASHPLDMVSYEEITVAQSKPEWTSDGPSGMAGDNALYFNGVASRITVPDPDDSFQLDLDLVFTLQAYVKYNELPYSRCIIFSYGVPGEGGYSFSVTNDPRKVFVTTYGILDADNDSSIPDDGRWHHIAVVHDEPAGEFRFYVDGEVSATLPYTGGLNFALERNALYVGVEGNPNNNNPINPFKGYIDRIRIHNAVLTPDEFDMVDVPAPVKDWALF
ncbi:MAG: hypothetical protein GC154_04035 [bacterium]|nr:hypothetical protein [bacterium]